MKRELHPLTLPSPHSPLPPSLRGLEVVEELEATMGEGKAGSNIATHSHKHLLLHLPATSLELLTMHGHPLEVAARCTQPR